MEHIVIRHRVEDYAKWKEMYDGEGTRAKACGSKGARLFRNADDPNELVVLLKWDDLDKARQFVQSEELKDAMQRGGVTDLPDILILEEIK
jgi:heme-degrading monooxygenase HmoA